MNKQLYSGLNKKIDLGVTKPLADNKFNTLAALTSSHLKTTSKFQTRPIGSALNFSKKVSIDKENSINTLGNRVEKLNITKSEPSISRQNETDWCNSLTNALLSEKKPSASSLASKHDEEEEFEPMFVDSSDLSTNDSKVEINQKALVCSFDVRLLLKRKKIHNDMKKVSRLGKVICRNYDKFIPFTPSLPKIVGVRRFAFTVPSPDDIISSHLRRK